MAKSFSQKHIKSIVYGGLDGIITTFAVVSGVIGAQLNPSIILILGFANLIADGISMAVGDYLSTKAEQEQRNRKSKVALLNGLTTFGSFVIFGFVPLAFFLLAQFFPVFENFMFVGSIVLTGVTLVVLGFLKAKVVNVSTFRSSMETLIVGGLAAGAAYLIGWGISGLV